MAHHITALRRRLVAGFQNSIRRFAPAWIGVVGSHLPHDFSGVRSEILLIYAALLIDNKSHDARVSVGGRPCDEGKAPDHVSIDDIIVLASGRLVALTGKDFEKIAMKRLRLGVGRGFVSEITFALSVGNQRPK